jgi:hypothetical protein
LRARRTPVKAASAIRPRIGRGPAEVASEALEKVRLPAETLGDGVSRRR